MTHTEKLPFETLPNTRDFGGFPVAGGVIRPCRLLRSSRLADGSPADIAALAEKYHVSTVVDMRTPAEQSGSPDPLPQGAVLISLPILNEQQAGITHEETLPAPSRMAAEMKARGLPMRKRMCELYDDITRSEFAQKAYARFFDILTEQKEGAVLWHCSAGKDRAGMAGVFVLAALGASPEDILEDYLATQQNYAASIEETIAQFSAATGDADGTEMLLCMMSVYPEYIETAFQAMTEISGSMDAYLTEKLHLTEEKRLVLREMYVTDAVQC